MLSHDAYSPISLSQSTYLKILPIAPGASFDLVKLKYPLMTAGLLGWGAASNKSQLGRVWAAVPDTKHPAPQNAVDKVAQVILWTGPL